MKPLRIFTPVFGEKNVNLLEKALATSLRWPKNLEAIKDAKWTVFVHPSEFNRVIDIVTKVLPAEQIETIEAQESLSELTAKRGVLMCRAFCQAIKKCLDDDSQMLISTADFVWSDGSIENMRKKAELENVCVSIPHPRVIPTILPELTKPMSSYDLFTLARGHFHKSWTSCEFGKVPSGSFKGGILWRDMGNGIVALQHRIPSPYLLNLIKDDLTFFSSDGDAFVAAWGAVDHNWAEHLIKTERWRMILHSDVAFMAEVTDPDSNVPPMELPSIVDPDAFWHNDYNFKMNRQFVATFRGAP